MNDPHVSVLTHNIDLLSKFNSLEESREQCIADCTSTWFFEKQGTMGKWLIILYRPLEFFGLASERKNFTTVLKTVEVSLSHFSRYLQDPSIPIDDSLDALSSWIFFRNGRECIRRVYRLFDPQKTISFRLAQQAKAFKIISCISGALIPWEVFFSLIRKEPLTGAAKQDLDAWIESVARWQRLISPWLYLFLFEEAAKRCLPKNNPQWAFTKAAFFLAWRLFQAGLTILEKPWFGEENLTETVFNRADGDIPFVVENELPIAFPREFPVQAFAMVGRKEHMILASLAPLLFGMWQHNVMESPSVIPYLEPFYIDPLGRFVVVETIIAPMTGNVWEGNEVQLVQEASHVISLLLKEQQTPLLNASQFFLTLQKRIRLLAPLKNQHQYLCVRDIERFIIDISQGDTQRIRTIMLSSGFLKHPAVQIFAELLKKYALNISSANIQMVLEANELRSSPFEADVVEWTSAIRRHADRVYQDREVYSQFHGKEQYLDRKIADVIVSLQKEVGFCSLLPENLSELIVSRLCNRA